MTVLRCNKSRAGMLAAERVRLWTWCWIIIGTGAVPRLRWPVLSLCSGEIWPSVITLAPPRRHAAISGEDDQLLVDQHRRDAARTDRSADLIDIGPVQDPRVVCLECARIPTLACGPCLIRSRSRAARRPSTSSPSTT